jgi:hypothetical protein
MIMFIYAGIFVLSFMLCFQVWNFWKYRDTNGAQKKRIIFLVSTIALIVHEFRLLFEITTGMFLLIHIVFLFFLFDIVRVKEFFNMFRK